MMLDQRDQIIRERAYALWEEEGRPHGSDLTHWLRAETELAGKSSAIKAAKAGEAAKPGKAPAPRRKRVQPAAAAAMAVS
jgi:hypothetical protein